MNQFQTCINNESESLSVVSNSLWPMDCTVHGILQARILEWVVVPFSRGSFQPRDWTQVSLIAGRFFTNWAIREAPGVLYGQVFNNRLKLLNNYQFFRFSSFLFVLLNWNCKPFTILKIVRSFLFLFFIFHGTKMSWIAYNSAEVLVFIIEGVRLSLWHP